MPKMKLQNLLHDLMNLYIMNLQGLWKKSNLPLIQNQWMVNQ